MKKIIIYCDRCNKEMSKWDDEKTQFLGIANFMYDDIHPYLDKPKDLCESCYNEFYKWWNLSND